MMMKRRKYYNPKKFIEILFCCNRNSNGIYRSYFNTEITPIKCSKTKTKEISLNVR